MAYPPAPAPMQQPPAPVKQGNGFGVTALVLGLVGLIIFSWIPGINLFTGLPLALLAIIFGIVALVKARSRGGKGKGTGGTGLVLGVLAIIVAILVNVWLVKLFDETSDEVRDDWIQECSADGLLTEQECADSWEQAEEEVYGG